MSQNFSSYALKIKQTQSGKTLPISDASINL
jgi:hypothetical protein